MDRTMLRDWDSFEIIILDERQRIQNKLQEKGVLKFMLKNLGGLLKDGKRLELCCLYTEKDMR